MNALVLDPHQDGPKGIFPGDRERHRQTPNERVHSLPYLIAVGLNRLARGPIILADAQIIPGHFIHPDREHRFKARVDPGFDQPGEGQLVNKKSGSMTEIEDQRMAQAVSPQIKGGVGLECLVKPLVEVKSLVEIVQDLGPFLLGITLIKNHGSGLANIHFIPYLIIAVRGKAPDPCVENYTLPSSIRNK